MIQDEKYWANRPLNDEHKDWRLGNDKNWVEEYTDSADHPHRRMILEELLNVFYFKSVFEVGCNAGPNLMAIHKVFPNTQLGGCDVNQDAVTLAQKNIPRAEIYHAMAQQLPVGDGSYDVVLADAVLMYVPPKDIRHVLKEMDRVAKKAIILVEWKSDNVEGELKDFHWARNYKFLLEELGYEVTETKINEQQWPSRNWTANGAVYLATKKSQDD